MTDQLSCASCKSVYRGPSSPPVLDRYQEARIIDWLEHHGCPSERKAVA